MAKAERETADSYGVTCWLPQQFGLQVRLPQVLIFNRSQTTGSRCDAGVTQLGSRSYRPGVSFLEVNRVITAPGFRPPRS